MKIDYHDSFNISFLASKNEGWNSVSLTVLIWNIQAVKHNGEYVLL